ncbi:MAG TPA: tRNA (adenosine(37)-N6)-threonylcarbamoyltransferase complex transferase subunit TsaD [Patescibacteria group bacterium]|nr:tRNA (adenosine(37)-N6)-threonylcarbamoyltransferase complex transferase subunit TsaD [Patescibacteria group bacterium]
MLILGIESSCDDTSVALLDCSDQGHVVLSEKTASQIDIHKKYGGVVPEIAGRMHAEKIVPLVEEVLSSRQPAVGQTSPSLSLERRGNQLLRPDAIAVTAGPGLITGLVVGVEAAKTLSYAWNIPLVAVNHIEGHIHSVEISNSQFSISKQLPNNQNNNVTIEQLNNKTINRFPALCLVVSGGHTELILMRDHGDYKILGRTKDDATGECFDKVAKLLGLPYPGGPQISKLAETGRIDAIDFPRPMLNQDNFEFSFAGLKTSALYWLRDNPLSATPMQLFDLPAGIFGQQKNPATINDFCASFEQAIIDVLVGKTLRAIDEMKPKTVILAGGVSANKKLRQTLGEAISTQLPDTLYLIPDTKYAMDNGAMIAVAGYYHALKKEFVDWKEIEVNPNWRIDTPMRSVI